MLEEAPAVSSIWFAHGIGKALTAISNIKFSTGIIIKDTLLLFIDSPLLSDFRYALLKLGVLGLERSAVCVSQCIRRELSGDSLTDLMRAVKVL